MCLLLGGLAYGQAASPVPPPHPAAGAKAVPSAEAGEKPAETKVSTSDPVITVKGACTDPAKKAEVCETVVTREQFERLADALQPGMSPPIKLRLANAYSKLIGMSKEAEKRGLEKQPKFEANMGFARMQILSQQLTGTLQEEAYKVADPDIEKYYQDKIDTYEEASLLRLFIPRTRQVTAPKVTAVKKSKAAEKAEAEAREKAGEAAMKKAAADLRARAAKGENFETLEKEAYLAAGLKGNPPTTKMEKVRIATLPPAHHAALELKAGEVSQVISDPTGHYIYKLVSKQTLSLDTVKAEIKNWIATQRFRDAMQEYQGSSNLNQAYFGITAKPKPPAEPGKPASAPEEDTVEPD
ncbi:MAG: peptidyl-prolyl cis-trans isomerase [Acidobacteriales bacterium]|nr:peptidyl-prolyl cis-trans isomerase [Candidatus Koribacter versatilis]MBI3644349.1 peptidyl-prolyl cis-trans isomerase [Terriglobales bacterium]